jgi:hypothetical protein
MNLCSYVKEDNLSKNMYEITMALQFMQAKILRIYGSSVIPHLEYVQIKISFP